MEKTFKLYTAGSIGGLTFDEATDWRKYVAEKIAYPIQCYSPLRGKQFLRSAGVLHQHGYEDNPMSTSRGVMGRDYNDVRTADCLLVNLYNATTISIGTVMEIAWAYALQLPVVLVAEKGNIHEHCMLSQVPVYTVRDLDTAIHLIEMLLLPLD